MKGQEAEFVGVVLAGGKSSRMGQDKALLTLNDRSMLDRSIELLKQLGASEVIVCRNDGEPGSVPDVYPNLGPLSGVHSAIHTTELPLMLIPVDMPLLDIDNLSPILLNGLKTKRPCYYENQPMPAFIPNNTEARAYLECCLSNFTGDKSMLSLKRFLQQQQGVTLVAKDKSKLINVNTPEQFSDVQK